MLEISNYWDDFPKRVSQSVDCLCSGRLPKLERLTVHLTECCNLKCQYCNMELHNRSMDQQLAERIVREFADIGGGTIHFTGGEPSIVPYIEDICGFAKKHGLTVSMNTNAVQRIDVSNVDKLKTSFDTPHRESYRETYGFDCFETVVENLRFYSTEMKEKMLSITAVLNAKTYEDMSELAKFVHENFDVYNLYYSNYKGNDERFVFEDSGIEEMFAKQIPATLAYFEEIGAEYSGKQLALYRPGDFANVPERFPLNRIQPCYIQLSEMTVGTDGVCHNCSHLFRDGVVMQPPITLENQSVGEAFVALKKNLAGNITFLSEKCLNGCNTNLIGFNSTVAAELKPFQS